MGTAGIVMRVQALAMGSWRGFGNLYVGQDFQAVRRLAFGIGELIMCVAVVVIWAYRCWVGAS